MAHTIVGRVVSDKNDKTIVVKVSMRKTHPIYKKQYPSTRKFMAHDEASQAKVGDLVRIIEVRPMSANKRFRLDKVIEKAGVEFLATDATADVDATVSEEQKMEAQSKTEKTEEAK